MKSVICIAMTFLIVFSLQAQSPARMSYQSVIRDAGNNLVSNHAIGIRVSILQGSASGAVVFSEIFNPNPQTNSNGLVSIEIGSGIPITGSFAGIDWTAGPYFISTEIYPTGGTNYTITVTTQILSVPFALHATTADSITGNLHETDPIFGSSIAFGINGIDTAYWNDAFGWGNHAAAGYVFETRTLTINGVSKDLSANRSWSLGTVTSIETNNGISGGTITSTGTIGLTGQALALHNVNSNGFFVRIGLGTVSSRNIVGGTGIIVSNGSGVSGDPIISAKTYQVGEFAHGGIVFWVDETGQHGLICAKTDQSTSTRWSAGTYGSTEARGDGVYAGQMNTAIIISAQVALGDDGSNNASKMCNNYQVTESGVLYGGWYLPSKYELNLMYLNRAAIDATALLKGGTAFENSLYYSSTESSSTEAWLQSFPTGTQSAMTKDVPFGSVNVRAIRAF